MNSKIRSALIASTFLLGLAGCSDDDGISSSGGGSASDGGAESAQYAGTYKGKMDVAYKGDDVDGTDSLDTTIVIHKDGTVTMTIDDESVKGGISGNQLDIKFTIKKSEDGVDCEGDARVQATVSGTSLSGPVSGDAECKFLLLKKNAVLTGTINAKKV